MSPSVFPNRLPFIYYLIYFIWVFHTVCTYYIESSMPYNFSPLTCGLKNTLYFYYLLRCTCMSLNFYVSLTNYIYIIVIFNSIQIWAIKILINFLYSKTIKVFHQPKSHDDIFLGSIISHFFPSNLPNIT